MSDPQEWADRAIESMHGPDDRNDMDEIRFGLKAIFEQHAAEVLSTKTIMVPRSPTNAMRRAAVSAVAQHYPETQLLALPLIWQAMYDAYSANTRELSKTAEPISGEALESVRIGGPYFCSAETFELIFARLDAAEAERDETKAVFDKMWEVDQRAVKAWQKAHPDNDLVSPDRTKRSTWLLSQLDTSNAIVEAAQHVVKCWNSPDVWGDEEMVAGDALTKAVRALED